MRLCLVNRNVIGFLSAALLAVALPAAAENARNLLVISVDGLKPEYVMNPEGHGLKIPNLRQLLAEGAHAMSVKGVFPASTFPSHATLLTGASPAEHGIYFNRPFDPDSRESGERWDWYYDDIQALTIWKAAADAGLRVANVGWPVSVGALDIHDNIPERVVGSSDPWVRSHATPGLLEELESRRLNACLAAAADRPASRDWMRTCYALEIIRRRAPNLLTVHLAATDSAQHSHGPFAAPVYEVIEEIDEMIGLLTEAFREMDPDALVAVVSDHGHAAVTQVMRIDAAFVREGLVTLDPQGSNFSESEVADWIALRWPSGGSAPVFLKNPEDAEVRTSVETYLRGLAADPDHGIAAILDREEIARLGGNPHADFWIDLRAGFTFSQYLGGQLTAPRSRIGTHGYSPDQREMDSVFLMAGSGVMAGARVGRVDMRTIAPTLAAALRIPFSEAAKDPLPILDFAGIGSGFRFVLADFESLGGSNDSTVLFRSPGFSGDNYGFDSEGPNFARVTKVQELPSAVAGNPSIGDETMHVGFRFSPEGAVDLDHRYVRLRTVPFAPAYHADPVISFEHVFQFDVYVSEPLEVVLMVRETDSAEALGEPGGRSGNVKWLGGSERVGNAILLGKPVPAGEWVTVSFDIPVLAAEAVARTGEGPLVSSTGKGVFEALAFIGEPGKSYDVYLDNFCMVSAPADLRIEQVYRQGETIHLEIWNPSGRFYRVERATDLNGEWETIAAEQAGEFWNGGIPVSETRSFWRLVR